LLAVSSPLAAAPATGPAAPLVFVSDRDGNPDLYLMSADGCRQVRLTTDPAPDWSPRWSPDGSWLAFYGLRDGSCNVWVMKADGTGLKQVTSLAVTKRPEAHGLTWSPDGGQIVFEQVPGFAEQDGSDLWRVSADGTRLAPLTTTPDVCESQPDFSPDGSRIVYVAFKRGEKASGDIC
jgi:Tol biopolymer transport system component